MSLFATPFVDTNVDTILHVVATVVMLSSVVLSLWVFWKVHELPIHKAKEKNKYHQIELVTILTWIGFIAHWVWVIAVFIAFIDVDKLIRSIVRIKHDVIIAKEDEEKIQSNEDKTLKGEDNA